MNALEILAILLFLIILAGGIFLGYGLQWLAVAGIAILYLMFKALWLIAKAHFGRTAE